MSIIDKGVDPTLFVSKEKKNSSNLTLKLGMLAFGVSLGIIATIFIVEAFEDIPGEPVIIAMVLLFGGASLIVNFLIERKMDSDSRDEKRDEKDTE